MDGRIFRVSPPPSDFVAFLVSRIFPPPASSDFWRTVMLIHDSSQLFSFPGLDLSEFFLGDRLELFTPYDTTADDFDSVLHE